MHLPLIRGHYQCAGKGKETLKETPRKRNAQNRTDVVAGLTQKQCRTNKIAPRCGRSKHWSDDFGND
jgi:hypothetical protein